MSLEKVAVVVVEERTAFRDSHLSHQRFLSGFPCQPQLPHGFSKFLSSWAGLDMIWERSICWKLTVAMLGGRVRYCDCVMLGWHPQKGLLSGSQDLRTLLKVSCYTKSKLGPWSCLASLLGFVFWVLIKSVCFCFSPPFLSPSPRNFPCLLEIDRDSII